MNKSREQVLYSLTMNAVKKAVKELKVTDDYERRVKLTNYILECFVFIEANKLVK